MRRLCIHPGPNKLIARKVGHVEVKLETQIYTYIPDAEISKQAKDNSVSS